MNDAISGRFSRCKESVLWVQRKLNGLSIAEPCKRSHLSGGCLHASVEHGMAILVLIERNLCGSALALIRPQFEAYLRGAWLTKCASDSEVDKAGQDDFPKIDHMIASLEKPEILGGSHLSGIKRSAWKSLNSLTHTGYQQIGPRLSVDSIGPGFDDDQIRTALEWAESLTILGAVEFAGLARNDQLLKALLLRVQPTAAR